jgi:hypothetical protein
MNVLEYFMILLFSKRNILIKLLFIILFKVCITNFPYKFHSQIISNILFKFFKYQKTLFTLFLDFLGYFILNVFISNLFKHSYNTIKILSYIFIQIFNINLSNHLSTIKLNDNIALRWHSKPS